MPWRSGDAAGGRSPAPMRAMQAEINRIFDDMWREMGTPLSLRAGWGEGAGATTWPALDVSETDTTVEIAAELPGLAEKDVELSIVGDLLTIKGEKRDEKTEKKQGYAYSERSFGSFQRSVALPDGLNSDKASAAFKNGVLTVSIPKSVEAKQKIKTIPIAAKS
jgi:HSP20 family protein